MLHHKKKLFDDRKFINVYKQVTALLYEGNIVCMPLCMKVSGITEQCQNSKGKYYSAKNNMTIKLQVSFLPLLLAEVTTHLPQHNETLTVIHNNNQKQRSHFQDWTDHFAQMHSG